MRQSYLILSNALVIWVSRILLLVPQLILVPYLIGTIGEEGYGVYALIWSLLMGIDQLETSLQQGVVKYSAAFLVQKRIEQVNRVVSSSFVYSILLGVVASASIIIVALWEGHRGDLGSSLFIIAILVVLIIPLTPYIAVIQSRQQYYVGVVLETLSKYLSLGIILTWFTLMEPSIEALIVIMATMLLLSRVAQVPIAYRLVPGLRNRPSLFQWTSFQLILAFGGMTVLIALCNIANTTGLRWLMRVLVSTNFVAHLAIIMMPGLLLTQILHAVTVTIMPATSAYEVTGNKQMLKELLIRSMRYTAIIVLTGVLVAVLLVKNVLGVWVGSEYRFLAPYTLAIFISVGFLMTTSSAHHMLKGLGKLRITVISSLVGKVVVPLPIILIVFFNSQNPYLAVTVGLAAGNVISGVLYLTFAMRAVDAGNRETFIRVCRQPLIAAGGLGLPMLALVTYFELESLIIQMVIAALGVLAFWAQMYFVFATPAESQQAREILKTAICTSSAILKKGSIARSLRL